MSRRNRNQGVALFAVLVLLLLSLVTVLGALRVAGLNEILLGNSSDYARAQAAAMALLGDAEIDIRGRLPPYTLQADGQLGIPCDASPGSSASEPPGHRGCRDTADGQSPWFPQSSAEFDAVSDIVGTDTAPYPCKQAICLPANATDLAHIEDRLPAMAPLGATYGQYTRARLPALGVQSNPILGSVGTTARSWYWIEGFRYSDIGSSAHIAAVRPEPDRAFIYRITAVAFGLKPGTRVVVQSVFVPYPASQNP